MKFGVNTLLWTGGFGPEHLPLLAPIREHGFDVVEIARFEWESFDAAPARREAERLGLGVVACTAFTSPANFVNADPAARAAALAFVKSAVDKTAEMGASTLVGPLHGAVGALVGRRRDADEWAWLVEGLRAAGEYAASAGVTLAVEPLNRFETYVLNTAADAARACAEVGLSNVGILYDTFHANIEEKSQSAGLRDCGEWLRHVHSCENDRGAPGSGHVEWNDVFAGMRGSGYGGCVVIESFGFAIKEIAAAACIWRDLAVTPDAIAWDGLRFLRSC